MASERELIGYDTFFVQCCYPVRYYEDRFLKDAPANERDSRSHLFHLLFILPVTLRGAEEELLSAYKSISVKLP